MMEKRSQKDLGEERVTARSRLMMSLIARTPSFVSSSTSVSLVKRCYGNQDPWKSVAGEDRSGQLGKETESFSSTDYSKLDYDRAGLLKRNASVMTHDRSGKLDNTCWNAVQQICPHHEAILLDGTAQSVRYGETLRDRSGRLDNLNSQEVARRENSVM